MLVIFFYLKKLNKEDYFIIFGLSYFAFIYPTTFFPVNVAHEGAMAFLILSILEVFDNSRIRKGIIRIVGSVFLLYSYESTIGLFVLLLFFCLLHPSGKSKRRLACFLFILCCCKN